MNDALAMAEFQSVSTQADVALRQLASDAMKRWRLGEPANAAELLRAHPFLLSDRSIAIDLAYEEFCLRLAAGEDVDPASFCASFPEIRRSLQQQIDLHNLLEESPELLENCINKWPNKGDILQGFEIEEEIGRGAFARVYRAREIALGCRSVVVKVSGEVGSREARVLGRLKHRNIVPIHSVRCDQSTGTSVICMPDYGHVTLSDLLPAIKRNDVLSISELVPGAMWQALLGFQARRTPDLRWFVVGVVRHLLDGLAYAHSQGILHLDIKPSNVLLASDGVPRLLDFNLSHDTSKLDVHVGGTLPYMSPEHLKCLVSLDGSSIDERSDVYSVGALLCELLTGDVPFLPSDTGRDVSSKAMALLDQQKSGVRFSRSQIDRVGPLLAGVVERCLAFASDDRFQTAASLANALDDVLGSEHSRCRRRSFLAGGLLCGCVALTATGSLAIYGREYLEAQPYSQVERYLQRGEYKRARDELLLAVGSTPSATNCALLAYCCAKVREHREACHWYCEAIGRRADCASVFNNLGYSYFKMAHMHLALAALDSSVLLNGSLQPALHNRAIVRFHLARDDQQQLAESVQDIRRALGCGAPTVELYRDAAFIFSLASQHDSSYVDEAKTWVQAALEFGCPARELAANSDISLVLPDGLKSFSRQGSNGAIPRRAKLLVDPPFYGGLRLGK